MKKQYFVIGVDGDAARKMEGRAPPRPFPQVWRPRWNRALQSVMNARCIIALAAMGFFLTGCASSFQTGNLGPVKSWPPVEQKKTIFVDLAFSGKLNGEAWPKTDSRNQHYLKQHCIQALENSGMFSFVSGDLKSTDLRLYIAVINDRETASPAGQLLSACTLYLVPNTSTDNFRLMAVLKNTTTGKEEHFQLDGGVIHRQHLLLGLLAPFKPGSREMQHCTDRLLQNLCLEIHRSGMVK